MSYRNNRPAQRPEPEQQTPRPATVPSVAPLVPAPKSRHSKAHRSSKKKFIIPIILVVALLVGAATWFMFGRNTTSSAIDGSKYQAVFFTNGQVYFGKLTDLNGEYLRLTNVFYPQEKNAAEDESLQSTSQQNANDIELIKLGNEIHGPSDEMLIAKEQVLFFENLKPDGTVSKTISDFEKK